jgi:Family of unknown function (DUF6159)
MFARIRRGWELTKTAWTVVRSYPGMARLPLTGGALALLALAALAVPGVALIAPEDASTSETVGGIVLIAAGAYLATFAVVYYNVALAAAADDALAGREPDIRAARAVARSRLRVIASWAIVSVVVSAVLAFVRDRAGAAGGITASIGGAIWSLVTFLVVPVLAFEGIGPVAAMKRSASLFRQRWGQQVTGNLVIGGVAGLVMLAAVALAVLGVVVMASGGAAAAAAGAVMLAVGVIAGIAAAVFSGATRGVFGVALYRYVADNRTVGPFTVQDMESAVRAA